MAAAVAPSPQDFEIEHSKKKDARSAHNEYLRAGTGTNKFRTSLAGHHVELELPDLDEELLSNHHASENTFSPYTIFFVDNAVEERFRRELNASSIIVIDKLVFSLLWIALSVFFSNSGLLSTDFDSSDYYASQIAIDAVGLCAALCIGIFRFVFKDSFVTYSQRLLFAMISVMSICWVINLNDDENLGYSDPLYISIFQQRCVILLVIMHIMGELIFPFVFVASWLVYIAYLISSLCWRYAHDDVMDQPGGLLVGHLLNVAALNCVLCYGSWKFEIYRRRAFYANVIACNERKVLRDTADAMQDKVAQLMQDRWHITDNDTANFDLRSPLEKALAKLAAVQNVVDGLAFEEITDAIELIGKNMDGTLFAPQLDEQFEKGFKMDNETYDWISGLLQTVTPEFDDDIEIEEAKLGPSSPVGSSTTMLDLGDAPSTTATPEISQIRDTKSSSTSPQTLSPQQEKHLILLMQQTEDWNFDVFEVNRLTHNNELQLVSFALFQKYDLFRHFNINKRKFRNFLHRIERGYLDNPYHNSTHAADVMRTVHFFFSKAQLQKIFTPIEIMAGLIAACIHDFDHPGVNNTFLINTREARAILYNDRSVLENHHIAAAFKILFQEDNNFLESLRKEDFNQCRALIVEIVLATDLRFHFDNVNHFTTTLKASKEAERVYHPSKIPENIHKQDKSENGSPSSADKANTPEDEEEKHLTKDHNFRTTLLKMSIKCADVGHTAKVLPLHVKWTERVIEEFYAQGDQERKAGLPVSPFMDRENSNVPKAQIGFIDFLVLPMYEEWMAYLEECQLPCLKELINNKEHWKKQEQPNKSMAVPQTRQSRLIRRNSRIPGSTTKPDRMGSINENGSGEVATTSSSSSSSSSSSGNSLKPPSVADHEDIDIPDEGIKLEP